MLTLSRHSCPTQGPTKGLSGRDLPAQRQAPGNMRKSPVCRWQPTNYKELIMDIERINVIGTTLSDLTQRTLDLRGYL